MQTDIRLRIGVLTFHRCINYGSYWQARCLTEGLRGRGFDAVLLDHQSSRVDRAEWRCALQPALPRRSSASELRSYRLKTRRFLDAFWDLPRSPSFPLEDPRPLGRYDIVVVGSDEVWNLRHPWYGGQPLFYGSGLDAGRIVSYAASFGSQDAADGLDPWWADMLGRFDSISVRDDNSAELLHQCSGVPPEIVLDPCLQFPEVIDAGQPGAAEPYIAVYGHSFPPWFTRAIRGAATARGWRLISIGYRNDWVDEERLAAAPRDFAAIIAGAAAVVTNFFHGCVFALLNAKPFVCIGTDYRANKIRDLTSLVGAGGHRLVCEADATKAGRLLGLPLDKSILERIAALRARSDAFLASALA